MYALRSGLCILLRLGEGGLRRCVRARGTVRPLSCLDPCPKLRYGTWREIRARPTIFSWMEINGTRKGNNNLLRRHNRALIVSLFRHKGPLSRADLSRLTGLAPSVLSRLSAELIAEGLVWEPGKIRAPSGRPPVLLSLSTPGVPGADGGRALRAQPGKRGFWWRQRRAFSRFAWDERDAQDTVG